MVIRICFGSFYPPPSLKTKGEWVEGLSNVWDFFNFFVLVEKKEG